MRRYLFHEIECGAPGQNHLAQWPRSKVLQRGTDSRRPLGKIRNVPACQNSRLVRRRALPERRNPILQLVQCLIASSQIHRKQSAPSSMNDLRPRNKKVTLGKLLPTLLWISCCSKALTPEESHPLIGAIQERQQIPQAASPQFSHRQRLCRTGARSPEDLGINRGRIQPQR